MHYDFAGEGLSQEKDVWGRSDSTCHSFLFFRDGGYHATQENQVFSMQDFTGRLSCLSPTLVSMIIIHKTRYPVVLIEVSVDRCNDRPDFR